MSEVQIIDLTGDHDQEARRGARPWGNITGITLHQTGIMLGNNAKRFHSLKAHIGIPKLDEPTVYLVYPLEALVWHGNNFNRTDVGIEVNGCFEGIDGKKWTAWKKGYRDKPHRATEEQIAATRFAVKMIIDEVAKHGGEVQFIHAHRQTNRSRQSDPGSRLWQEVAIWAQNEFGLSDGGEGFTLRDGMPIPREWDSRYKASY